MKLAVIGGGSTYTPELADGLGRLAPGIREVVLVDPIPTGRRELTRFHALNGKTWNPPALSGDLLVRNDQEAACYRLPVK